VTLGGDHRRAVGAARAGAAREVNYDLPLKKIAAKNKEKRKKLVNFAVDTF